MKFLHSRVVFGVLAVLVVIGVGALLASSQMSYRNPLKDIFATIARTPAVALQFEIADTEAKQELGLSNRAMIPDNYAMLFVFKTPDRYGFWMKDMLVPLDITWLSDTGTIILIDHSVDPSTYPHPFYPPVPVRYVVETQAGYANDHGWTVGTTIPLPAPYAK